MELSFTTRALGDATLLEIVGEIDIATAPRLRAELIGLAARPGDSIVVDLSAVEFIDSTGLGVLIGARRRVRDAGGDLRLVLPPGPIRDVFAATDLIGIFTIVDSVPLGSGR